MSGTGTLAWARAVAMGCTILMLSAASAKAESAALPLDRDIALPSTTAAREPTLNGTIIHDALVPFIIRQEDGSVECRGNLQNRVVRSTATGHLDFYYRIRDTRGPGEVRGIDTSGFRGETLRIAHRTDGLGTEAPTRAYRPAPGSTVIAGGMRLACGRHEESRFIVIRTEATEFETGATTIHATHTVTVNTVSPE